ncbi:Uncharacterized metal-binding protein YceD, DUF177 family [Paracoccus isoporae]|uniref:Uncharacterized metal-binding protein YceD, DUF177 family n=1 Tax=Paracoccus isoporae TaxID=591205 RepID=A0A1G7AK57_9RHOB|nr:DUF177 domain-containing protein [Paracoccus isoporae]SDE14395.1 Uncharacterized metal-binding protein YceD, DUF177 family [Paracoccus isoporae]
MSVFTPLSDRLRVAHLSPGRDNEFTVAPDAAARRAIAAELGLSDLPDMRFEGAVRASGADEWALSGRLSARVVQPCVITLEPVETEIAEPVSLIFSPHVAAPEEEEVEMGDDSVEPLGQTIDIGAIAIEALSLALPTHPRAPGAEMPEIAGDDAPGPEETRKPFAGLAEMMKKEN